MSRIRRSLTVTAVASLLLSGLAVGASADQVPAAEGAPLVVDREPAGIARGLIVQTTTTTPSDSLLEATDEALGAATEVADDATVTERVSAIAFDEEISSTAAADAAAEIEKRADVVWATPDTLRQHDARSPVSRDDPYYPQQRNLWNSSMTSPAGGYSIKAPAMWKATEGSSDIRVAVLDTGIRKEHPDLAGQLVPGYDMVSADQARGRRTYVNAVDGDGRDSNPSDPGDWATRNRCGRGSPAWDSSWHGTFVAGQIAARSNNGKGIAGIAPKVKVQPVRVLGRCGGWDSDIIAGITWASGGHVKGVRDNPTPAQVVNLSLGGLARTSAQRARACKPFEVASAAARRRGTVVVAASGNDNGNANRSVPSSCAGFVSVGATSKTGFRSSYSNFGTSVDVSAPGGDSFVNGSSDRIVSLGNTGRRAPKKSTYVRYEGTSMAAPQVSAAAALLYSLGMDTPQAVEAGVKAATTKFRRRNSGYTHRTVRYRGKSYRLNNLNCSGSSCGKGILDLSRVNHPLAPSVVVGDLDDGHPVAGGRIGVRDTWVRTHNHMAHRWYREPASPGEERVQVSTANGYVPVPEDVGHRLTAETRGEGAWAVFRTRTSTGAVRERPDVHVYGPEQHEQGATYPASVYLTKQRFATQEVEDGPVEISFDGEVVGTATTVDGRATFDVPASAWQAGGIRVTARYLGAGDTAPAESEARQINGFWAAPVVTTRVVEHQGVESEGAVEVTVDVSPGGGTSVGQVHVTLESTTDELSVHRGPIEADDGGRTVLTLERVPAGSYELVVSFTSYLRHLVSASPVTFTAE